MQVATIMLSQISHWSFCHYRTSRQPQ